jgi:hypothetical protein
MAFNIVATIGILKTCKDFVVNILQPFRLAHAQSFGLGVNKKFHLVHLLLELAQINFFFLSWVQNNHPKNLFIFICVNCTNTLQ